MPGAGGGGTQTPVECQWTLNRLNNVKQCQLLGWTSQRKAARHATLRNNETGASKCLKNFAKKMYRNLTCFGELVAIAARTGRQGGEIDENAGSVIGSKSELHRY